MPAINANCKLLLHFDGADAATTFTDSSGIGKVATVAGNAQLDTAYSVFGTASGLFDGNGDYITFPDSADWAFGTGDFTIDFWIRFNSTTGDQVIVSQYEGSSKYWLLQRIASQNKLAFQVVNTSLTVNVVADFTPTANIWYHVALVKVSNAYKFFINGTQVGADQVDADAVLDVAGTLRIGQFNAGSYFNGWLDEFQIVKGTALYTADFTPPVVAYGEDDLQPIIII